MSLDAERWQQVKALLGRALELPAAERPGFLQEQAAGDPELLRWAETYLAAYESGSAFLAAPGDPAAAVPSDLETPIGPYRLLRRLGAGGMGEVFLAEQDEPLHRTVALKLIRPGLGGAQGIARFAAERQALALMSHPNIARVFDAGESRSGRPWVAMELIDGPILTDYCDATALPPQRRLELFAAVCRGVQHAHQKGIIHRDLKPSNVLVALEDGAAVPKIIDFGVAKAVTEIAPEEPLLTEQGQWLGTPGYMSPEQAGGSGGEVDTRSDVYSLGALLYELLTGVPPFDPQELRRAGLAAMLTTLREREPPRMSVRVADLGARAAEVARARGLTAPQLVALLRGDLDQIVRKALEKDPDLRYASAAELAADVERSLHHEPVLAGTASTGLLLRKLVRRHRLGFTAAGVVLLALLAGIAGTGAELVRALKAERAAREQARRTEQEAAKAQQVTGFLLDVFRTADPGQSLRPGVTLRELLDQSAARVRTQLAGQPLVQAQAMLVMGRSYHALGEYAAARGLLEQSAAIRRRELGGADPAVAESLHDLAWVLIDTGDSRQARKLLAETLAIRVRRLDPSDIRLASSFNLLGLALKHSREPNKARRCFEIALALYERQGAANPGKVAMVLCNLGLLANEMERDAEGQAYLERALRLQERSLGPRDPALAFTLNNLAMSLANQGHPGAARPLFARAVEIDRAIYGPNHPNVAIGLLNLAETARNEGDCPAAVALFEQGLSILRQHHPESHPTVKQALGLLATAQACAAASHR